MAYVVAEIGSNHNGNLNTAKELIRQAWRAEAMAVKFQLFRADDLYERGIPQWEAAHAVELDPEWLPDLAGEAGRFNLDFGCSVFAPWAVNAVDPYVRWHKVASLELTDVKLVECVASKRKPIVLSTGAATAEEVSVVRSLIERSWWGAKVCLMQCTCAYPAPADEVDLLAMTRFPPPYGYSDHTLGIDVAPLAAALGASVIEKHLTLDRSQDGPDHHYAVQPDEFAEMVRRIRVAEQARGSDRKYVRPSERELRKWQHQPDGMRGRRGSHVASAV